VSKIDSRWKKVVDITWTQVCISTTCLCFDLHLHACTSSIFTFVRDNGLATMVSISLRRASLSGSYTASIYSCNSSPNTHLCSTSREQLVPKQYLRPRSLNLNNKHLQAARGQTKQKRRMVGPVTSDGEKLEQKKSYGIGGAGNIRMFSPSHKVFCFCQKRADREKGGHRKSSIPQGRMPTGRGGDRVFGRQSQQVQVQVPRGNAPRC
jgi:hypothetical protein